MDRVLPPTPIVVGLGWVSTRLAKIATLSTKYDCINRIIVYISNNICKILVEQATQASDVVWMAEAWKMSD